MQIEEAKDILLNVIADEVIGTYCIEIQREVDCSKNCEDKDCYLNQAIEKVINELKKKDKVIDEMAEKLVEAHGWFYSEFDNYTKEDWKEYFYKKVEDKKYGI